MKKMKKVKSMLVGVNHFLHLAILKICLHQHFHFLHHDQSKTQFQKGEKIPCTSQFSLVYSIWVRKCWTKRLPAKAGDVNGTEISCADNVSKRRRKEWHKWRGNGCNADIVSKKLVRQCLSPINKWIFSWNSLYGLNAAGLYWGNFCQPVLTSLLAMMFS